MARVRTFPVFVDVCAIQIELKKKKKKKITGAEVIADMKHFSFKVIDNGAGRPIVKMEYKGETKKFVSYMFAPLLEKSGSLLSCFRLLKKSLPWSSPR